MEVGQVPFIDFPSIGTAISAAQGRKISLPVTPSMYIYSQLKHVSGVPAPDGVQGVSIARLQVLDRVLGELARLKEVPRPSFDVQGDTPEKHMNSLLEHFQTQLHEAHLVNTSNPYSLPAPQAGAMLSLSF